MRLWHPLMAAALILSATPGCSADAGKAAAPSPGKAAAAAKRPAAPRDNFAVLAGKLRNASRAPVSIVQLGDSHTAADLFSGELRTLLQARYGDGGIGLVPATAVPGIRNDRVIIDNPPGQWQLVSARNEQSDQFPLGGYLSLPQGNRPSVSLRARNDDAQRYRVSALYRASQGDAVLVSGGQQRALPATQGQWRFSPVLGNLALPLQISLQHSQGVSLGGWYLQAQKNAGVIYSTLGINGARLEVVDKWQAGWQDSLKALHPDLLIFAYGTNEAFDDTLDLALYESQMDATLTRLRRDMPQTAIVLVGPPDSIKQRRASSCAARQPQPLAAVVRIQRQLARKHRALFWDWQAYMGGPCSISRWQAQGLARTDLVHLSADGYRRSANGLFDFLKAPLGM